MTHLPRIAIVFLSAIAALVLLLLYGPLAVAIFFSIFRLERNEIAWSTPSLDAYADLVHNRPLLDALVNTAIVGAAAVGLALALGTLLAFQYRNTRPPWRDLLQLIIFVPFLMPPIITGLSLLIFFRETDVPRSLATVVVGHTVFVLAIVYRVVLTRLDGLKSSLVEASYDLGATRWQTFRHVLLPNLASAMAAAGILAFALSFDETLITLLVTGTKNTLPMWLWSLMRMGFTPDVNALVTVILAASTGIALLALRLMRPR